jgi:hypothetical protein
MRTERLQRLRRISAGFGALLNVRSDRRWPFDAVLSRLGGAAR